MNQVIKHLNVAIDFDEDANEVTIDATQPLGIEANYEYVSKMRASIVVMGPLLARNGLCQSGNARWLCHWETTN